MDATIQTNQATIRDVDIKILEKTSSQLMHNDYNLRINIF